MTRRRRDPRAETLALTTSATPPPHRARHSHPISHQPPPPRPRSERAGASVQVGTRRRFDWSGAALSKPRSPKASPAGPTVRIIEDPAFLVLVVPDQPRGELTSHDRQLIAAGRILADAGGRRHSPGTRPRRHRRPCHRRADRLIKADFELFTDYCPEQRAASVLDAMETLNPRHVLFAESADGGADLARRVAASTGERLFPVLQNLTPTHVGRRARGGSSKLSHAPARLMTIALDAVPPLEDARHEARVIPHCRRVHHDPGNIPPLSSARRSRPTHAGRSRFHRQRRQRDHRLGAVSPNSPPLGATRGGSRVVCDAGHLPRDRQIGASGTLVTARCYFALGIAGAPSTCRASRR